MLALALVSCLAAAPASLEGTLTGEYAAWGPSHVEAYASRDLTRDPLASAPVDLATGAFRLSLPEGVTAVQLALVPDGGTPYPWLLTASPHALAAGAARLAVVGPPAVRDERQAGGRLGLWFSLAAALALGVAAWALRRRDPPPPPAAPVALWPGLLAALPATLVLAWGLVVLDEPFDLLEHTYFQEAYAGATPWEVATAPVVAERAHAPGYAVLLWLVARLGQSELLFRLPALLAQLGATVALYHLLARATGRRLLAVGGALVASLLPLSLRYGRDATPYSLHALYAVLSTGLLLRALAVDDRRAWRSWAVVSAVSFLTHYFAIFLAAGQALAALVVLATRPAEQRRALLRSWLQACLGLGAALALWAPEIARQFVMSAGDNQVTQVVYPLSPGFGAYVLAHLRVLMGVPDAAPWLLYPVLALFGAGAVWAWRTHRDLAVVLLVPLVLVLALLGLSYGLHVAKFAGRVYFGWRWLRGFVPAVGALLGLGALVPALYGHRLWAAGLSVGLAALLGLAVVDASQRVRPAQDAASQRILTDAQDGDVIFVLPAPFYTVGLGYVLHDRAAKYIHPGPSIWSYYGEGRASKRVFGPVRSFGLPVETLVNGLEVKRAWVVAFEERLFGRPEFDEEVTQQALADLDARFVRQRRLRLPFMTLSLYDVAHPDPWAGGAITLDTRRLWQSLALLPSTLDPDSLVEVQRGLRPIDLRIPTPIGRALRAELTLLDAPADVALEPAPRTEHPGEARLQPPPVSVQPLSPGVFRVLLPEGPGNTASFELRLTRSLPVPVRLRLTPEGAP